MIAKFNDGVDNANRSIDQPTSFLVGAAFNFSAPDLDRELKVMERKVKAGANFILTQPVYDPNQVELLWQRLGGFPLPVIMGVLPLRSERHAQFLHNEVPGINIPKEAFQRISAKNSDPAKEGISMSQELLRAVHQRLGGVQGARVAHGHLVLLRPLDRPTDRLRSPPAPLSQLAQPGADCESQVGPGLLCGPAERAER